MKAVNEPRRIAVLTTTRADYAYLRPVIRSLADDPRVSLQLLVAGTHLVARYGVTVSDIEEDGFAIARRMQTVREDTGDSAADVAEVAARTTAEVGRALRELDVSLLVLLGDRYEVLGAALAAVVATVPIAHLHGGETTLGAIDNSIRHALTKLSQLHFCSIEPYAIRLRQLGEAPERVFVVGAPTVDTLLETPVLGEPELEAQVPGLEIVHPFGLVTVHPNTLEPDASARQLASILQGCDGLATMLITHPSLDAGSSAVVSAVRDFVAKRAGAVAVPSLGQNTYGAALRLADVLVGNSSSGIIEAATFGTAVVNVGDRQAGRLKPPNVLDADSQERSVRAAIREALSASFQEGLRHLRNPYGDGKAGTRIAEVLATHPLQGILRKPDAFDQEQYLAVAARMGLRP